MHDPVILAAVNRIELEYAALPGLKLTPAQVNRLCDLPREACEAALRVLITSGFLQIADGAFLRLAAKAPRRAIIA